MIYYSNTLIGNTEMVGHQRCDRHVADDNSFDIYLYLSIVCFSTAFSLLRRNTGLPSFVQYPEKHNKTLL